MLANGRPASAAPRLCEAVAVGEAALVRGVIMCALQTFFFDLGSSAPTIFALSPPTYLPTSALRAVCGRRDLPTYLAPLVGRRSVGLDLTLTYLPSYQPYLTCGIL